MDEPESIGSGPTFKIKDTSDEFNLSNKLLLESIRYAFVYTTRIDDMILTKHQNSPEILMEILKQSKPIFNEKRAKKNIFKKRLNMRYDLKKLQSNPDFNWKKKKDLIGYKNLRCLSDARRLCKPVTIDLCKTFEKFLGEGSVELHLLERNISSYNKQNYLKHDLSESSETISACNDYSDIENVNPLGIQIVDTCSLSTKHEKEEPIMTNNFSECRNSAPYRAILVMIDEKQKTQKIYDVQIGSCIEIKSTYNSASSHINIKYCCYCKRNLILQNLVKNKLLIPVTTLKYFCQNVLCSTNTCDCCCKFTVHTNVICYLEKKKYNAVSKGKVEIAPMPIKQIETETLSKFQYRYVHKYKERGVQETEEMYVIFSYVKKYSNKYNPKYKYEVYHIDKLSRIKSHLTYIVPPVLRVDSPKYMFDLCCWFKRIKIVYSLEVALAKSLTYLKTTHSCSFNNCNCCCSALTSTIPAHKDWDVRYCPLLARSFSSDIDILRARWKPPRQYDICAKRKSNVICSKTNLQADSGIAESINSTKNVQEAPQKTAELINIPESHTTSVANGNIDSGFDIENSLPAYVLATKAKSTDLPPSQKNNDNNINFDISVFKQARLRLTPDRRITAVFSNLEQKLTQNQLMGMCRILNIAQKHVHLIDFSKENAMEDLIKISAPEFNEIKDTTSVPIITNVFSLAEPGQISNNVREGASPSKNITQPSGSQPNISVDVVPPSVIQPILYRKILDQSNVSQRNAGQCNVGQANVFFPITIQGQNNIQPNIIQQNNIQPNIIQQNNIVPNIIQQNNIVPNIIKQNNIVTNIIQQNNIPSNIGSIILPNNMILLPNLVVAPNYNLNIVNTISDNSSVRHESNQGVKRQAIIDNSVKRFASEKLVNPFPIVQSVNSTLGGGQQENSQNESELENENESILGL